MTSTVETSVVREVEEDVLDSEYEWVQAELSMRKGQSQKLPSLGRFVARTRQSVVEDAAIAVNQQRIQSSLADYQSILR